jgi:hypothetical protein
MKNTITNFELGKKKHDTINLYKNTVTWQSYNYLTPMMMHVLGYKIKTTIPSIQIYDSNIWKMHTQHLTLY